MITLYGLPHCDTVKRARAWLAGQGVTVHFHDVRPTAASGGLTPALLRAWQHALGWEALLNRKGTTWRRLDEARRERVQDADAALALILDEPSVMKRPVVVWADGSVTVGFDPEIFARQSAIPPEDRP